MHRRALTFFDGALDVVLNDLGNGKIKALVNHKIELIYQITPNDVLLITGETQSMQDGHLKKILWAICFYMARQDVCDQLLKKFNGLK